MTENSGGTENCTGTMKGIIISGLYCLGRRIRLTLTGTREVHGRRWLYGRRAAEYRLDVRRDAAGRRLPAGRQRRARRDGRVAGRGTGDASVTAAVDGGRHFVVVVHLPVAPAPGRFPGRFRTVVARVPGRVVVPGGRLVSAGAVVVLLLVLFHLLSTLGAPVLEPNLIKKHTHFR